MSEHARLLVVPVSDVNAAGLLTGKGWATVFAADFLALTVAHAGWSAALREVTLEPFIADATPLLAAVSAGSQVSETASALLVDVLGGELGAAASLSPLELAVWVVDAEVFHEVWGPVSQAAAALHVSADVVFASPEMPGAQVVKVAHTIDFLRGAQGCPWVQEQTHESVLPFVVAEAEEVTEAYLEPMPDEKANRDHVVQELGDLLFQVLLHARLGTEEPLPYTVDDAALALHRKLVRRNPHIFARPEGEPMPSVAEIVRVWNEIKAAEKSGTLSL